MTPGNEERKVLFLSVGGSLQPLQSSLREGRPDHVVFVVSDGRDGSRSSQDVAKELQQTEGCPSSHQVAVPPDDIDDALARIKPELSRSLAKGARVTVDYTGGTKSMTSAMVLAATSLEGVRLQFMAGTRIGLDQIEDGTEGPVEIPTELVGLSRTFGTVRGFIGRRNYGAALSVLRETEVTFGALKDKVPGAWRRTVGELQKWVAIFDHWDRFDHKAAWIALQKGFDSRARHAAWFEGDGAGFRARLERLAASSGSPSYELLEDLWLNAERRAALGLHDDAVARLYRLMEAAVQARLWKQHGKATKPVALEELPESLREKFGRQGVSETAALGLSDSISYLAHLDSEDPLLATMGDGFPDWQGKRNSSILAHGFRPLVESDWQQARSWFEQRSAILWRDRLGGPSSGQLPDRLPEL